MELAWYVITIVVKCKVAEGPVMPGEWGCSQDIHLVRAADREAAYERALEIGKSAETSYLNDQGQLVKWEFVGLENVEELASRVIRDGMEIWSRIFYTSDPEALVVGKEGLSVFHNDDIRDVVAEDILEGITSRLICNRVRQ